MNRFCFIFLLTVVSSFCFAQNANETINELKNLFSSSSLNGNTGWRTTGCNIEYNAPIITIYTVRERRGDPGWTYKSEKLLKFDLLKASFDKGYGQSLEIYCKNGVTEESVLTTYSPFGAPNQQTNSTNETYHRLQLRSDVIINRIINAFNNLKSIANEQNVKSKPHMFDDAELAVQKISFISPDNTGKLKANQTGCIRVEIKNTNTNSAFGIACIVKEKSTSDLFSYEQYTSVDKIEGFNTEIINIPIKASENVDNSTYQFVVTVSYKGNSLKEETINITASNPKRQKPVANTSGGSRNKTVRMRKMSGNTYLISCKVNGLPLDFIFDTGASSVTLSRKQALFMLRNGYLSKNDIIGSSAYQTASGDITVGTVIKLKKIEINGLVLNNVEASIINSDSAPLLLGQSALSRLGKIQIDYKNSTLTIIR